jgi:ESCRT-II complex subunit VPS36
MGKAKDLVGLAERFRVEASRQHEGGDGVTEEESNAFNNYLLSLGIATPVTKQSAGALFHSELARQLCDFLAKPLQHAGGNMSLADVYCLFNRARGTGPRDTTRHAWHT